MPRKRKGETVPQPPTELYLQWEGETPEQHEAVTWCAEQLNDGDTHYIRADQVEPLLMALEVWQQTPIQPSGPYEDAFRDVLIADANIRAQLER